MRILILAALLLPPVAAQPAPVGCEGVIVKPGAEIEDLVTEHRAGTTYCIQPGLYRLTKTVVPKTGDRLIGSPGAVLNGAKLIVDWERQGSVWVAKGQTQRSPASWNPQWPEIADAAAQYNEDLFLDDRPRKRVLSAAEVAPGKFFFDYDHATIAIGENPAAHRVECSATEAAIEARAPNVVVRGLTIERYTVRGIAVAPAALIEKNEVRYVHGTGIRFGTRCRIVGNYVHHNGKYGMNGGGEDALLEGNELAYNNAAAYHTKGAGGGWDAGATKFAVSTGLVAIITRTTTTAMVSGAASTTSTAMRRWSATTRSGATWRPAFSSTLRRDRTFTPTPWEQ